MDVILQRVLIMWDFQFHYIFLPVHCSLCRHCWMHFNQAQWRGEGWVLRPGTVMYWHCQGLSAGMHATGWHSSLIQCCCHMESILLQQYQIQPTSHPLEFKCNRPFFVNDLVLNARGKISTVVRKWHVLVLHCFVCPRFTHLPLVSWHSTNPELN